MKQVWIKRFYLLNFNLIFRTIHGVATLGSLKAKVLKGTVKPSDAVDKAAYHTFKKVTLDTSLEKLDRILDKEHFALVVHSQRLCKYEEGKRCSLNSVGKYM